MSLSPTTRVLLTCIALTKPCMDHFEQLWFLYFLQKLLGEAPDLSGSCERETGGIPDRGTGWYNALGQPESTGMETQDKQDKVPVCVLT